MKITFDSQIFILQRQGGISRYFAELVNQFGSREQHTVHVVAPIHANRHLSEINPPGVRMKLPSKWRTKRFCHAVNAPLMELHSLFHNTEIFHETYYGDLRFKPKFKKKVITVHDMIDEWSGNETNATLNKKRSIDNADHIICVSHNTRRDLHMFYPETAGKASVVHHGYTDFERISRKPSEVSGSFFLYVGNRSGYKNFDALLRAFSQSKVLHRDFRIVCFGGGPVSRSEKNQVLDLGLTLDHIVQIDGGDDVLADLYFNATALVYPSRLEGFGFPPLEAMSASCPVICSKASSIPEIVGDAGLYFDPSSTEELSARLVSLASDSEVRAKLTIVAHKRLEHFSWSKAASETLATYSSLL